MYRRLLLVASFVVIVSSLPFALRLILQTPPAQTSSNQAGSAPELSPSPELPTNSKKAPIAAQSLYLLINAHRKDAGLSPLSPSPKLEQSAQLKINDMIEKNYWQHTDPTNVESWPLFKQAGYEYLVAGENLSFALNSAWDVFSSWVASPTHNAQLLNPEYEDLGVAIDCHTYQKLAEQPCIAVLHLGKERR